MASLHVRHLPFANGNANMAKTYDENGKETRTISERKKLAGSFIGPSGETGPMSKKEYNEYKQFILDNTTDGSAVQKDRLKKLKKQRKFGV